MANISTETVRRPLVLSEAQALDDEGMLVHPPKANAEFV